jgi:hypothetical protein
VNEQKPLAHIDACTFNHAQAKGPCPPESSKGQRRASMLCTSNHRIAWANGHVKDQRLLAHINACTSNHANARAPGHVKDQRPLAETRTSTSNQAKCTDIGHVRTKYQCHRAASILKITQGTLATLGPNISATEPHPYLKSRRELWPREDQISLAHSRNRTSNKARPSAM